jgi:hypothetical protein
MTAQFRWKAGTHTKATIQADTAAAVSGWTHFGKPWALDIVPVIDRYVEEVTALDGSVGELGKINFTVSFIAPSATQIDYLHDTFFAGGVRTAAQTLQVYDFPNYGDQWITVNCTGRAPGRKAALLQPRNGRIPYYTFQFYAGVIAASGA